MTFGFRCPKTGLVEWVDTEGEHVCPYCRLLHQSYSIGPPAKAMGFPRVIGDRLPKYYDWGIGAWIDSKKQRRNLCQERGLNLNSATEYRRNHGDPGKPVSKRGNPYV